MSSGSSDEKSQSNQRVWAPQGQALAARYPNIGEEGDRLNEAIPGVSDRYNTFQQGVVDQANPAFSNQLAGGAYNDLGDNSGLQFGSLLDQAYGSPTAGQNALSNIGTNNYSDAYKQNFVDNAGTALGLANASIDARASGAGMGGSSRHGIAQARATEDITDQLQQQLNQIGYQDFTQNAQRQLGVASQADQIQQQQLGQYGNLLGQGLQGQQQAQQYGLGYSQQLANLGLGEYNAELMPTRALGENIAALGAPTVLTDSSGKGGSSNFGIL